MPPQDVVAPPAYTARVLSLAEWEARQAELPYPPGLLEPNEFKVLVVVEDADKRIVASWAAVNVVMLEGLQVTPTHRHGMANKHLLFGMLEALMQMGTPGALTVVTEPAVAALAEKSGFVNIPGALYQIDLAAVADATGAP